MSQVLAVTPDPSAAAENDGWIRIFDGKSLEGWQALSNPRVWRVLDGVIHGQDTGSGGGESPESLLFYTKAQFRDFECKADIKLNHGGISSIYFRTAFVPGFAPAYIAQANNTGPGPRTGSLYGRVDISEQLVPDNTWWTQHVVAVGNHIRILVNGVETVNYFDPDKTYTEGYIALLHFFPGTVVEFRNLMIRRMSAATV
ncbi:MAG: DUF1080 domain-containing protein [Bryobacterales bacterium]|nr:DUF1080 domain-containing protein [Bryobacterales bacterium]